MKKILLIIITIFTTCVGLFAQDQEIILTQNSKSGIYSAGQKIAVKVFTGNTGDTLHISIIKNNSQIVEQLTLTTSCDTLLAYEGVGEYPCSMIVEAHTRGARASLGLLVDPEKLNPGADCPKDFDEYWTGVKAKLKELPFEIKREEIKNSSTEKGIICENIEINCTGPRPARGYFARPVGAQAKSLPAVLLVHAAGVKGSWCRSEPGNALEYAKMGALCFDLNAHGMLNGQPDSYYADLENGELKAYWLQGLTNKDDEYFGGMYQRLLRTIEFLARQKEWDGKRLLVIGESQGGGQALVAAGLDNRVSAVVAIVPAMCDWFGSLAGRMGGWPQPFESNSSKEDMMKALPYFDASNILKDSKAIIFTEIGLIDMVCPATSVYAAINQAKSQKLIFTVPYRPHHQPEGGLAKKWSDEFYTPRELFIQNYLK